MLRSKRLKQLDDAYDKAFELVDQLFSAVPNTFGCTITRLKELSYVDAIISYYEEIETVFPSPDRVYHVVSDDAAKALYFTAEENADVYDAMKEICTRNLLNDAPLPRLFRLFIVNELTNGFKRAKRRGPPPSPGFALRAFVYTSAVYVADATGLPLTRNVASNQEHSACDAIVDVAPRHGLELEFTTVRDWCLHKDYKKMRAQANTLNNYEKDLFLKRIGLLKTTTS
jgi:dsDNA-binding SOS-regulon protein